jgi:hypothetical protein
MVPVNIRQTANEGELGNKVSSMFVELPVAEADPRRSYDRVRAAAERHKAAGQPRPAVCWSGSPSSRRRRCT